MDWSLRTPRREVPCRCSNEHRSGQLTVECRVGEVVVIGLREELDEGIAVGDTSFRHVYVLGEG